MSKKRKITLIISSLFIALLCFHQFSIEADDKEGYKITDIRIYKDTPAWELALAVKRQRIRDIMKIVEKKPDLLNYQDPKYGATLLIWAVGMEKYRSAEALLQCGADPDIATTENTTYGGETPLFLAAGYSWIDRWAKKDPKYVKLLLNYGADPNKNYTGFNIPGSQSLIEVETSPLMNSIGCGIEKTKALVEAGAEINYKTTFGTTATIKALMVRQFPEYAHYLIVGKYATITEPFYRRISYGNEDPNEKFYPVDLLRNWVFALYSEEYRLKMQIVKEFARQGVNYWETKIHKSTLEHIQKLYPDTWEEYIKKY